MGTRPGQGLRLVHLGVLALLTISPAAAAAGQGGGSITGQILDPQGAPLAGVSVTLTGGAAPVAGTTDNQGRYTFPGLTAPAYTVTPSKPGVAFDPLARTVTLLGGTAQLDFTGSAVTFTVSGVVVDINGSPMAGVAITASGGSGVAPTDIAGRYVVNGLAPGAGLTLTPSLAGFAFTPASQNIASVQADATAQPFVAMGGLFRRFFAEGAVNGFFDTTIALLNPTLVEAVAHLTFQPSSGPALQRDVTMAALSRATVDPKALGLTQADFATVVESNEPIVADRTMTWDATGYGSHAETSVDAPRTVWYFAEGSTTGSFNLFYLLQNPGSQAAQVEVRYLRPAPLAPIVKTYTVGAASRRTIYVNQEDPALGETDLSAVVTSLNSVPIIAERAMYTDALGQVFGAGHEAAGIAAPSTQWFLAEGATGPFFNLFILVANPTGTAAELEFRYLLTDGRTITRRHTAAPDSRLTIGVHTEGDGLDSAALSTVVTSTNGVPVLVERAMWWPANGAGWYEAHASAGATATGTKWALADGEAGGPRGTQTYVLIANPATFAGAAVVTLVFETGGTATKTFALLPSSRFNVDVGAEFPEAAGRRFGTIVESIGATPAPIVVERAMYSNAGSVLWAAGTNVVATRLTGRVAVPVIQAPPAPPGVRRARVTTAGILGGDPETPAIAAIPDVVAESGTPQTEIAVAPDGHRVARTAVEIAFARTATVAQVDAVLDALAGRIINAIAGVPIVVVRIPDPGSYDGLQAVIARAASLPSVRFVNEVDLPEPEDLPDTHVAPAAGTLSSIDHLLAARAPAAWNARAALDSPRAGRPLVVVTDFFGAGAPNSAINASFNPWQFTSLGLVAHGYHVLGIMAGTFPSVPTLSAGPADTVVGLFPGRSNVQVFDYTAKPAGLPNMPEYANDVVRLVRDAPGGVVVNSSIGFQRLKTSAQMLPYAQGWIEKVRTAGVDGGSLESRFVHAQAAGNSSGAPAALESEPAAATTLPNLVDTTGAPLAHLSNTLVVENRMNTPAEPFQPGCLKATSNRDGNIAAIGTDVFSLFDTGVTAGDLSGTSMASPLVAALAEYVWALDPTLPAQGVLSKIRSTARPGVAMSDPRCTSLTFTLAPAVDAYAAILAVDQGLASPLVRATLLDVVDDAGAAVPDGQFDEHDLERFVGELDTRAGTLFDYSRYDLNGDGRTGGTTKDRFDLDASTPAAWTRITETIEGSTQEFDETALTDVLILCYYAYSPLYTGDTNVRTSLLAGRCSPVVATLQLHSGSLNVGAFALPASHLEQLLRPNPQTDLTTPWEFRANQSASSFLGAGSYDATIFSDRVTVSANGFTGAELGFQATCAADRSPGDLGPNPVRGSAAYGAGLVFVVTAPHVRISWQADLAPAAAGDATPVLQGAQAALVHDDGPLAGSFVFETTTDAELGPIGFATEQVVGPGRYTVALNGRVACEASATQPHATTTGHARLTFTMVAVP